MSSVQLANMVAIAFEKCSQKRVQVADIFMNCNCVNSNFSFDSYDCYTGISNLTGGFIPRQDQNSSESSELAPQATGSQDSPNEAALREQGIESFIGIHLRV